MTWELIEPKMSWYMDLESCSYADAPMVRFIQEQKLGPFEKLTSFYEDGMFWMRKDRGFAAKRNELNSIVVLEHID